jgi:ZIP family zinc transporter
LLDGIPVSVAIGISLIGGGGVAVPVVAAVFLSNIPESLSASTGLKKAGHSERNILLMWIAVALVSSLAAALGFGLLGQASGNVKAMIDSFAAGAILTMLADTMMPEAFENGGATIGLTTVLGFALAFLLTTLD